MKSAGRRSLSGRAMWVVVAGFASACSSPATGPDLDGDVERGDALEVRSGEGVFLIAQVRDLDAYPDALAESVVRLDGAGCLRLSAPDETTTVIWPAGFHVRTVGADVAILDGQDREVGRIGDTFRLAGGEVPELHDGLGFTARDQQMAASRCPGRFWVVSPSEVSTR